MTRTVWIGSLLLGFSGCGASTDASPGSGPRDALADGTDPPGPQADASSPAADLGRVVGDLPDTGLADAVAPPAPDASLPVPDAARCAPCPAGTVTVEPDAPASAGCACHDPEPWAAPQGGSLDETLCLSVNVPGPGAGRDFFFARLAELGIATVRHEIRWSRVEPTRGAFEFGETDDALSAAEAAGVELLAMLGYGNPWASAAGAAANDDMYPPDDPEDFGRFAGAVAARYTDRITRYEIWNEQNAGYRFWKRPGTVSGDPVAYARLLRAAHDAILRAAPGAKVAFGGLFYVPQIILGAEEFLAGSYAALPGHQQDFEAVAFHPYMPYPPRVPPEWREPEGRLAYFAVDETPQRLRTVMSAAGDSPDKPLWVTEYGWPTLSLTETEQARYTLRTQLMLWGQGVALACVYTLMDSNPDADHLAPWEAAFGLYTWDPTPLDPTDGTAWREKLVATAWRRLHTVLGGARVAADLSARYALPASVRALGVIAPGGGRALVIWSVDSPETIRIPWTGPGIADAAALSGLDLVGGATHPLPPPADGWLELPATPDPMVITLP